jgi:gamma-carbonic anhydrase
MPLWRGISAVVRGVGSTLDSMGAALQGNLAPLENLVPPVNRMAFNGVKPTYSATNFVAPNATVIGNVSLGQDTSVWYGATLRGDVNEIVVGDATNIQDRVIIHVARHNADGEARPTRIGSKVRQLLLLSLLSLKMP